MSAYEELRAELTVGSTEALMVKAEPESEEALMRVVNRFHRALALAEKVKTDAHNEGRRDGYTQARTNHAQQPPRNPPTP